MHAYCRYIALIAIYAPLLSRNTTDRLWFVVAREVHCFMSWLCNLRRASFAEKSRTRHRPVLCKLLAVSVESADDCWCFWASWALRSQSPLLDLVDENSVATTLWISNLPWELLWFSELLFCIKPNLLKSVVAWYSKACTISSSLIHPHNVYRALICFARLCDSP